jgi:hypothetical protein
LGGVVTAAAPARAKAPAWSPAAAAPPVARRRLAQDFVPPLASLAAIPARPSVQRTCEACGEEKDETMVQPRLEVGPVGDRFEVEADSIAAQVMAMRDSEASGAAPAVQRACAACSASDDEPRARRSPMDTEKSEEEGSVQPRRTGAAGAPETIGASRSDLTSGGSPLPPATLDFFEQRMGRDLADVRVHLGGGAGDLNESIGARAFTFQNHVWLGSGEGAGPSFTMAHELAHVMQQTAPGPVGPAQARRRLAASGAGPALQRKASPFFLPGRTTLGAKTKGQHTVMHHRAIGAMVKENPGMKSEVAIPGATRQFVRTDKCGFADLYVADKDTVPGVKAVGVQPPAAATPPADPAATPPADPGATPPADPAATPTIPAIPATAPAAATASTRVEAFPGPFEQSCEARIADKYTRAPKLVGGKLEGMEHTPTKILVGEMKPAHDEDYRADGKKQVDNYVAGLKITIAAANRMAESDPGQTHRWNAVPDVLTDAKLPLTWTTEGALTTGWPVRNLKIRAYDAVTKSIVKGKHKGKSYTGQQGKDLRPPQEITGKWMTAKDSSPSNSGVFVYFLAPNPDDLKAALAVHSTSTEFKALAADITKIQAPLITPPKIDKTGKAKPRRLPAASRAGPIVRREAKDEFKAALWEAKRRGNKAYPKESEDNLLDKYDSTVSPEMAEAISERAGMLEWLKEKPATPGLVYTPPDTAKGDEIRSDMSLLKKLAFWTGLKAKPLGILREKFGGAFVWVFKKVSDFREKLKKRFSEKKEKHFLGGKKGTILKAAAKVAAIVLPRVVAPFMRTMYNTIVDCAVDGFKAKMKTLIEGSVIDDLITWAEEMKGKVDQAVEGIEAYLRDLVEKTIKPIQEDFQKFIEEMKFLMEIAGVIQEIAKAARIASCIGGLISAPETVGIGAVVGCGASLGDYILSKFGLSPIEYIVAMTLQSCESQNTIGRAIAQMAFLKSLSRRAGIKVIEEVKAILANNFKQEFAGKTYGQHASELFCDPATLAFPDPEFEPSDCSKTPRHPQSKTGDYEVPDSVPRYDPINPSNDPEAEARWQGHDGAPKPAAGSTTAPRPTSPATPPTPPAGDAPADQPTKPPASAGGGQSGGKGTSQEEPASVKLEPRPEAGTSVSTLILVHPTLEQGGYADKDYGGATKLNKLSVITSSGNRYGPSKEPIAIKVGLIWQEDPTKQVHKINFNLPTYAVLTRDSDSKWLQMPPGDRTGQVGGAR